MTIALVTGANSGIGFALARQFARRGDRVILVCRDAARGKAAHAEVAQVAMAAGGVAPTLLLADLSIQSNVRALAADLYSRFDHLDVLVNNAGAAFTQREITVDGFERTFATNHLAPFLLTTLLIDLLRAAPSARVVTVGADVFPSSLDFDNLQGERRYGTLRAYFASKLANVLFTVELARRLDGSTVTANVCGPGGVRTNFGERAGGALKLMSRAFWYLPFMQSPDQGARTPFYLATSADVAGHSGGFYIRCRERRLKGVVRNRDVAAHLWRISEQATSSASRVPSNRFVAPVHVS